MKKKRIIDHLTYHFKNKVKKILLFMDKILQLDQE